MSDTVNDTVNSKEKEVLRIIQNLIFNKDTQVNYFDGEENIQEKWKELL